MEEPDNNVKQFIEALENGWLQNSFKVECRYVMKSVIFLSLHFLICILLFILGVVKNQEISILIFAIATGFLFLNLPTLILFLQYIINSKIITINNVEKNIAIKSAGITELYPLNDIIVITKVCSYPIAENRSRWMASDFFFYYEILFKDSRKIYLTSLMTDDLALRGFKTRIRKRLVPFIFNIES